MRIPRRNLCRAFPELDAFSDAQCKLLMRRVTLDGAAGGAVTGAAVAAFIATFVVVAVIVKLIDPPPFLIDWYEDADFLIALLAILVTPSLAALLARDVVLRRRLIKAIHLRLDRVRCPQCQYILIGQVPRDGHVTCPECGRATALAALGVTEDDLIPPRTNDDFLIEMPADRPQPQRG